MRRSALFAAALFLVSSLVRADAPADQYLPFDSTDTTITDNFTKLTWSRTPYGGAVPTAVTYLDAAAVACPASSGTRVPTLKELLTLIDESPHDYEFVNGANPEKYIDGSAFRGTPVDKPFWTSTVASKTGTLTSTAFVLSFGTGGVDVLDATGSATAYVRCVK